MADDAHSFTKKQNSTKGGGAKGQESPEVRELTGTVAAGADSPEAEDHNFAAGKGHSLVAEDHNSAVVVDSRVAVLVRESRTLLTTVSRKKIKTLKAT